MCLSDQSLTAHPPWSLIKMTSSITLFHPHIKDIEFGVRKGPKETRKSQIIKKLIENFKTCSENILKCSKQLINC